MTPPAGLSGSATLAAASEDVFTAAPRPLAAARELAADAVLRGFGEPIARHVRRLEWDHDIPFMREDVWACSVFGPEPGSRAVARLYVEFMPKSAVVLASFAAEPAAFPARRW
jgi:hypothetical protein